MKLYLVRHGVTEWNHNHRFQGQTNIPLNEEGRAQAALLARRLRDVPIDAIYSSPLDRAYETAKAVADIKGMPIITDDRLMEINCGDWEGSSWKELGFEENGPRDTRLTDGSLDAMPGGESYAQVRERVGAAFDFIAARGHENCLIVLHGAALQCLICHILHMDNSRRQQFFFGNTSITTLTYRPDYGFFAVEGLNDTRHLDI
jgi:broad specificity phosphatase PhoE